jgi:hypothetical protein
MAKVAALNKGGFVDVPSVSCASSGNCAAGGTYTAPVFGDSRGFVATERNGVWAKAIQEPGLQALNAGQDARWQSVPA